MAGLASGDGGIDHKSRKSAFIRLGKPVGGLHYFSVWKIRGARAS